MPSYNTIAMFKEEKHILELTVFVQGRYPTVEFLLGLERAGEMWPFSISIREIVGFENQCAIHFIKGYAYALGELSSVPEVMCKGDERERYKVKAVRRG